MIVGDFSARYPGLVLLPELSRYVAKMLAEETPSDLPTLFEDDSSHSVNAMTPIFAYSLSLNYR
jgi:hypothetical protein